MMKPKIRDYAITMADGAGRTVELSIDADTINDLIGRGYSEQSAMLSVKDNAFQNAIAKGLIGDDAWIVA